MNGLLFSLGAGVLLAWAALPLLGLAVRGARDAEPQSRQGVQLIALFTGLLLLAVPLLRSGLRPSLWPPLPAAWESQLAALFGARLWSGGPSWPQLVGGAWVAALVAAALVAFSRWGRLALLVRRAVPASQELRRRVAVLAAEHRVEPPRVGISNAVRVPCVTGLSSPTLLLPAGLVEGLEPHALELALHHELDHLARGDHRIAALLGLLRLPLWAHPTARGMLAEILLAREEAVDARVAPADPPAYATLLLEVARFPGRRRRALEAVSMGDTALARRVDMITQPSFRPLARFSPVVSLAALLVGLSLFAPRVLADPGEGVPEGFRAISVSFAVGDTLSLHMDADTKRVAVGEPEIVEVVPERALLRLNGSSVGTTVVLVWKATERIAYQVTVTPSASRP